MSGFGAKVPSTVEAEGKALSPDPKQIAADKVNTQAEQARTSHGLPTPESTPGPDTARLEADKVRRQAEAAKAPSNIVTLESTSGPDTAGVMADKGKGQAKPSQNAAPPDTSPDGVSDKGQREYTDKQKNIVNRVLKCGPKQYYRILGVNDPSPKEESKKAYKKLALLLHPDKNKYEGAEEAFKLVNTAAKALGVDCEDFAENAYAEESDADDDTNLMDMEQSEAPKPDDFRKKIYEEATMHLGKLMENPKDAGAKLDLEKLNKQIKEQNLKDKLPKKDLQNFVIQIPTFAANFEMAQPYVKALDKDPADGIARKKLNNINDTLRQLNERHGYPEIWLINLTDPDPNRAESSEAAESSRAAASPNVNKAGQASTKDGVKTKAANRAGQTSTKGGVKTKVGVPIPDESDEQTSLGKVEVVRKAGFGSRVIVNRGTDMNLYFDIYPGADFGKGVAKEWLEEGIYESKDLPRNTAGKDIRIYGRVKVKKTNQQRINRTARTQSEIQYYLIEALGEHYQSTRSALSGMKGLSPAKLRRIDAQLDVQSEQLLAELDQCRENNEHPDTGEQLTEADIKKMPWLAPDVIIKTEDDDDDEKEDDDEDIENIVPQRTGLKHNTQREAASRTPEASGTSRDSVESEL